MNTCYLLVTDKTIDSQHAHAPLAGDSLVGDSHAPLAGDS
jgi:hypothetical protein